MILAVVPRSGENRAVDLSVELADWTDCDVAAFLVGRALAIFPESEEFVHVKGVFWTINALGNGLYEVLVQLAQAGVLEHRDEPDDQYRWRGRSGDF